MGLAKHVLMLRMDTLRVPTAMIMSMKKLAKVITVVRSAYSSWKA